MLAGEVDPRSRTQRVSCDSSDLISWARLLERRVSFALWAAAESCAVLSDEPKNFIKLCVSRTPPATAGRLAHGFVSRTESGQDYLPSFRFVFAAGEPPLAEAELAAADALAADADLAPSVLAISFW